MKSAISIISATMLLSAAYATSTNAQEMAHKSWYGEISVGQTSPKDPDYKFTHGTEKIPLDDGAHVRATVGLDFGDIRGDFRLSYYDMDGATQIGSTQVTGVELIYLSAMLNGSYDFNVNEKLTPFISAGAGMAGGRGEGTRLGSTEVGNQVSILPAVRAGGGVSYAVSDKVSIVADYDYIHNFASVASGKVDDFGIHSANLGLRFGF
jgi:opacity protein-like surface antigen